MALAGGIPMMGVQRFTPVRLLAGVLAAIVMIDAVAVGAPGLALLAVPFVIAAVRFTHATVWGTALLVGWAAFYFVIGAMYAIANGVDAEWADLLFAYPGTVVAAALAITAVRARRAQRSS